MPEVDKLALLKGLEFSIQLTTLGTEEDARPVRQVLGRLSEALCSTNLKGPLYAMVHEIAANSLKALYKRAFQKKLSVQGQELSYQDWLPLFRDELEQHNGKSLSELIARDGQTVELRGRCHDSSFVIEAIASGEPTELELERIQRAIERGKRLNSFGFLLLEEQSTEENREGGSLGIPLIIMSMRSLGLPESCFEISAGNGKTISALHLPAHFFSAQKKHPVRILKNSRRHLAMLWNVYNALSMGMARFDSNGNLISVSANLLERLQVEEAALFEKALPARFMVDLFHGDDRVIKGRPVEHYRIYMRRARDQEELLFNVSATLNNKNFVTVVFQELSLQIMRQQKLRTGSLLEQLRLHNMIEPYVPVPVLLKARESIQMGMDKLGDEIRDLTVFFADLAGFTSQAERMQPDIALEFLNIAMSISVRFIEKNGGFIDKFMGDAVMAIFYNPLRAIIAAVEIQNQFQQLNYFRAMSEESPINVRIGINTGKVILGNVGSQNRMDWTAIGDTVNTASRIEKLADPGNVLIGESTYDAAHDRITASSRSELNIRGKADTVKVYSVSEVRWIHDGKDMKLSLEATLEDFLQD